MSIQGMQSSAIPFGRPRQAVAVRRTPVRTTTHALVDTAQILGEGLFRNALVRERRRADRSNEPFALMLIEVAGADERRRATWAAVLEALAGTQRDTDLVGWFSADTVLGVILPDIASHDASVVGGIAGRVRRQLNARLGTAAAAAVSVQVHVHPEQTQRADTLASVDRLLDGVRWQTRKGLTYTVAKRLLDILGSAALLVVCAPLFLVIAVLIRLGSAGPVFFRQARIGQFAKPFTMLKFRTMHTNVDHAIHHEFVTRFISANDNVHEPVKDAPFKIANDPRITPIGRILRKTSLDELPQFWNVLVGEMSLVGPRPPLQYEVDQYKSWHRRRVFEVKPGITGLWQVAGRSRCTFDEMVRLDLRYARSCSLWNDIKILVATPGAVISGKGAA